MVRELSPSKQPKPALLTKQRLAALQPGQRQRDSKVKGLFCERGERGWSMKVQTALRAHGQAVRTFRKTLVQVASLAELDLEAVRNEAATVLAGVKRGVDPRAPTASPGQLMVRGMFKACTDRMRTRGAAERSIEDLEYLLEKYLHALADRAVADVKRSELRAEHQRITREHGPVAANKAMRAFRNAWNAALKQQDDPDALGKVNPVGAVTFNPERAREASIEPDSLADWYQRLQKVPTALRRLMHEVELFTGLRPGVVMSLEKAWIREDRIIVPREKMKIKAGKDFVVPLSAHLSELVQRALVLSHEEASGSPWLFPTRADGPKKTKPGKPVPRNPSKAKPGEVIATKVIRESSMPGETGHLLRKTYRTQALAAGVSKEVARMLMDHAVGDIEAHYVDASSLFATLLAAQEKISQHLLCLIRKHPADAGAE